MSDAAALVDTLILGLALVIGAWLTWRFIADFYRSVRKLGLVKSPSARKWLCLKLSGYSFLSGALMIFLGFVTMLLNYGYLVRGFLYTAMLVIFGALWLFFTGYMILNLARAFWAWREEKAAACKVDKES
jgi:hypothetical protein